MNTVIGLFRNLWNVMGCVGELLGYLLRFAGVFFRSRASLGVRLVAAESQLGLCKRRIDQKSQLKPRFTAGFRLLWVVLSRFWSPWQAAAQLMQPATVKAWHTRAFKLYWRWKSRKKPWRPPISQEMQELIRKISRENPLWGAELIRLTLLNLRYEPPCEDTIRKHMVKPRGPHKKSTTWLPFLRNHLDVSWAIDFFTINTIRFATLYVFIVLDHGRRKVVHLAITRNPSMRWVIQQLREAMPFGQQPRFLFLDNDGIYILAEYFLYYHEARAHLSLDRNSPVPRSVQPPANGQVVAKAYLGSAACITATQERPDEITGFPRCSRRQEQSALKPRILPSGNNRGMPSRSRSHLGASAELRIEPMRSRFSSG